MSNPDRRRPSVKSSPDGFIHDLTHRLLPTCFFLHFLITGSVFLVYAVNQQPAPRQYAAGASVAFGTLCGLYVLVFLVDYFRNKLASKLNLVLKPEDAASSTSGTVRDKRMHEQSGGFRNGLMELWRDLMKKTCLLSEQDENASEKARRLGKQKRGQFGGQVPFDDHGPRMHNRMDREPNPYYYSYEETQSAYDRREQRSRSLGHYDDNNSENVNLEAQNRQQTEHERTDLPIIDTICLEDQSPLASLAGPLPCLHDHSHGFPPCPESLAHVPSMSSVYAVNFDSTNGNASVDVECGTIPPTPLPHPRPATPHWLSVFGSMCNRVRESQYSQQTTGCPTPPHSEASTRSSLEVLPASTTRSGATTSMPTLPHPIYTPRPGNSANRGVDVHYVKHHQGQNAESHAGRPTPQEGIPRSNIPAQGGANSRRHAAAAAAIGRAQANTAKDRAPKHTARSRLPVKSRVNNGEDMARGGTVKWKKNGGRKVNVRRHSKMGPPRPMVEDEDEGVAMWR